MHASIASMHIVSLLRCCTQDLELFLLELVQALRYENWSDIVSADALPLDLQALEDAQRNAGHVANRAIPMDLTRFLIVRAVRNWTLANYLFWYLTCETDSSNYTSTFATGKENLANNSYIEECLFDQRKLVQGILTAKIDNFAEPSAGASQVLSEAQIRVYQIFHATLERLICALKVLYYSRLPISVHSLDQLAAPYSVCSDSDIELFSNLERNAFFISRGILWYLYQSRLYEYYKFLFKAHIQLCSSNFISLKFEYISYS